LMGALTEGQPLRKAIIEPGLVLVAVLGAALWIR